MTDNDLSRRPDGGPAFPVGMNTQHNQYACAVGMSLRDYFAAQVMTGVTSAMLTNPDAAEGFMANAKDASITMQRALAVYCYAIADAMLAERAKGKPE